MIRAVASILVKVGQRPRLIEIFTGNVANVRGEDGWIEYFASRRRGLAGQEPDKHRP